MFIKAEQLETRAAGAGGAEARSWLLIQSVKE